MKENHTRGPATLSERNILFHDSKELLVAEHNKKNSEGHGFLFGKTLIKKCREELIKDNQVPKKLDLLTRGETA